MSPRHVHAAAFTVLRIAHLGQAAALQVVATALELFAAPACGTIDSNISVADSVTISIRTIWLPSPGDELAPPHSTTSSASNCIETGTFKPSALAVLRLITSSNLVACTTGRSAGF